MYNFGKFAKSQEDIVAYGVLYKGVNFLRNAAGEDLVDVLKSNPHPFYIAVGEMGQIVSMESDPEAIQLAGYDIIGIDDTQGFTRGAGGTVYGAIWNGNEIIAAPAPLPDLSARQFWLAAFELGITEQGLLTSIADVNDPLYIAHEGERALVAIDIAKATTFRRDYPLIDEMAGAQGITPEQMDALWGWAAQME